MKRSLKLAWASVMVLGLLVVPAFAEVATETDAPTETQAEEAAVEETVEVTFNGMTIAIDKKTGRMRPPTQREAKRLARQMKRIFRSVDHHTQAKGEVTYSGGGMRSAVLGQNHLNFEMVHVDAEGNFVRQCVNSTEHAVEALATPIELAPAPEEQ